jgi:hypothetical protein
MQRRVRDGLGHQTEAVGVDEGGGDPAVGACAAAAILLPSEDQRRSSSDRVADTAHRPRRVDREDVSAVAGRSNRLGGLDPQPLAVDLAVFCWVAATMSSILAGARLARPTPLRRPTGGSRTVASHNHRLKPPRMFQPAGTPRLVVGPSQRKGGRRSAPARTGKDRQGPKGRLVVLGRNTALARQQQPCRTPLAAGALARSDQTATRQSPALGRTSSNGWREVPCRCDRYHVGSPWQG